MSRLDLVNLHVGEEPPEASHQPTVATLISGGALAATGGLIVVSVISRQTLGLAIPDGFEFAQHLMSVALFWGLAVILRDDHFITLDLVYGAAPVRYKALMRRLMSIATAVAIALITVQFSLQVLDARQTGQVTTELEFPIWPIYLLADIGLGLATLYATTRAWTVTFKADHSIEV